MAYHRFANKEAFDEEGNPFYSDLIFEHVDGKSRILPEDFYAADESIREAARETTEGFAEQE